MGGRQLLLDNGGFETLGHKLKHRFNLLAGHVLLVHDLVHAQILEVLYHGCNRQAGILKDPSTTHLSRYAFNCRTL